MDADRRTPAAPPDLLVVAALATLAAAAALVPALAGTPLRVALGLPLVVFLPGYALVAALFPERGPDDPGASDGGGPDAAGAGLDGLERVALSVALSVVVVPIVALALEATPWDLGTVPVALSVTAVTLAATAAAVRRRRALAPADRFSVPAGAWLEAARAAGSPDSRTAAAANWLLAATVVVAAASVGYAVAVPSDAESYTEFYLLAENRTGDLVAGDYPRTFAPGEERPLVVGVTNHEGAAVRYTVVVELQRVSVRDGSPTVVAEREVARFRSRVADGATWQRRHAVAPGMTGRDLRLRYLLYAGTPPADPGPETARHSLHLWITVTQPGRQSSAATPAGGDAP